MITIKDVARRAGVANSTVSSVLNGKGNISEITKRKVIDAANALNYVRHGAASELKRKQTRTIGVIVHDMSSWYFSDLVGSIQTMASNHGYDMIICSSLGESNSTAARYLKEGRMDGAIVSAQNIPAELLIEAADAGIPLVVMDRELVHKGIVSVLMDDEQGGYLATRYLIDCGHRSIAYVSGPFSSDCNLLRYQGFLRALQEAGMEEKPEWRLGGQFKREGGYLAAQALMKTQMPSAVFFANDEMAIGGIQAFSEGGVSVPNDISVVGFDNMEWTSYVSPPLTTFCQPKSDAGLLAGHVLLQMLNGEPVDTSYRLKIDCVERSSVAVL